MKTAAGGFQWAWKYSLETKFFLVHSDSKNVNIPAASPQLEIYLVFD